MADFRQVVLWYHVLLEEELHEQKALCTKYALTAVCDVTRTLVVFR
jgi:hypothetical protein